jgi:polysaccharide export outer membrane protein
MKKSISAPRVVAGAMMVGCLLIGAACTPSIVPTRAITINPPYDQLPAGTPITTATNGLLPPGYVLGIGDVVSVMFWREEELSGDVTVGPDGNITLPLINEIPAAGRTAEEVRASIAAAADKYVTEPTVSVVVKESRSRRVYVTGEVAKPGPYALAGPTTVLQMLAIAGGVNGYAKENNIVVVRTDETGVVRRYKFSFQDVLRGRNLRQNIELRPGDTIVVP